MMNNGYCQLSLLGRERYFCLVRFALVLFWFWATSYLLPLPQASSQCEIAATSLLS